MQPYTFPYIGYFQLINYVDKWVVFDDTQYISKGWVNRNRILHPDSKKEWQYFTIPVKKHSRKSKIQDIEINTELNWKDELLGKLSHYKKKAPFYMETVDFLGDCISTNDYKLSEWTVHTLKSTCDYLDLSFDYSIFSKMDINTENIEHAGEWALRISDAIGVDEYVNPPSGYRIFKENEFLEKNIKLRFLKPNLTPYIQRRSSFTAGLSIIDVLICNDKNQIREMLMEHEILTYSELIGEEE